MRNKTEDAATKKGTLFGIGAGPGDPELLTLKAVKAIRQCDVIAVPKTGQEDGTALSIIAEYLDGKELLECRFSMERDMSVREAARLAAAEEIMKFLDEGQDVAFVTLGDPTTYSTYIYVHKIVTEKGFEAEIIPGVTSFSAAAAALGTALCEDSEPLTIIPAKRSDGIDDAEELLDRPGNKVIMKSGENLMRILEKLEERGYGNRTKIACRVTMEDQRLFDGIESYKESSKSEKAEYFTTVIVKEKN